MYLGNKEFYIFIVSHTHCGYLGTYYPPLGCRLLEDTAWTAEMAPVLPSSLYWQLPQCGLAGAPIKRRGLSPLPEPGLPLAFLMAHALGIGANTTGTEARKCLSSGAHPTAARGRLLP